MSLETQNKIARRSAQPIERVKALVCEECWTNCFDNVGFEKLGRREVSSFTYTRKKPLSPSEENCPWCSHLFSCHHCQSTSLKEGRPDQRSPGPHTIEIHFENGGKFTAFGSNVYCIRFVCGSTTYALPPQNMFTQNSDIAAQQVTVRTLETNLSPANTREPISQWLKSCAGNQCCPEDISLPLPTRMIEVATPRLVVTNGELGKYAALSSVA
ncbi:hypothetical protein BCR34DRAFT_592451 [Clohesyomyces aquaticus]|uniref:Uncharacterized protein n=1 Tax=Clohesyomyces aquaticus TaxID=1231657 RepID=A0A1Y1YTL0_9PLEO|nr:hypothetical protein BCR34DRAFT_592451 [Clohesyomyces aquaticus]